MKNDGDTTGAEYAGEDEQTQEIAAFPDTVVRDPEVDETLTALFLTFCVGAD